MSHFTTVTTRMVEKEYLLRALADLGYEYDVEDTSIGGYMGGQERADLRISTGSAGYDIGFRRGKEAYEIVADWWGVCGVSQADFVQRVTQRYSYWAVRAKLENQGFTLADEHQQEDQGLHLVLRRMA